MRKLAIITTHPIQYNAPWFRLLTERKKIQVKVFYTWSQTEHEKKFDPGFGKTIEWDIPLLEGYDFMFVKNTSKNPGSKTFSGIKNPSLIKDIKDWQPDALLVFGWNFSSHLQCLRYFKNRIPVLFRGDSTLLDERKGWKKMLRRILLRNVYRNIDYALYVGTENKKYFLAHGLREEQLIFAPHAIDNARFSKTADEGKDRMKEIKSTLAIKEDEVVLLYAGKMEAKKNPEILLDVFKELNGRRVHLIMVGNGELENLLKEKYKDLKNLHFFPFQNQSELPLFYGTF